MRLGRIGVQFAVPGMAAGAANPPRLDYNLLRYGNRDSDHFDPATLAAGRVSK